MAEQLSLCAFHYSMLDRLWASNGCMHTTYVCRLLVQFRISRQECYANVAMRSQAKSYATVGVYSAFGTQQTEVINQEKSSELLFESISFVSNRRLKTR